jgi:hypothetical protein
LVTSDGFCFAPQNQISALHADRRRHRQRVAFPREGQVARPRPDVNAMAARRIEAEAERAARASGAAALLDRLLEALEAPAMDEAAPSRGEQFISSAIASSEFDKAAS